MKGKGRRFLHLAILLAVLALVVWRTTGKNDAAPAGETALAPQLGGQSAPDGTIAPQSTPRTDQSQITLDEAGAYDAKDDVALYIHLYGRLPHNFMTKAEARALGWEGGGLERYASGKCIGGDRFGNYEGLLPEKKGRTYTECDINTLGASSRGAERIVFSNDGLVYYTADHYGSFTLLYGEEDA